MQFREGRGSRGRRSFSNRTPSFSGDSHFQSLYDAHSNFRRNNDFRPIINNCQSLNSSSNSDAGGNYSYRGRNSRFNQRTNQLPGVKFQRPKPADYRTWEFAKVPPPNAGNLNLFIDFFFKILLLCQELNDWVMEVSLITLLLTSHTITCTMDGVAIGHEHLISGILVEGLVEA